MPKHPVAFVFLFGVLSRQDAANATYHRGSREPMHRGDAESVGCCCCHLSFNCKRFEMIRSGQRECPKMWTWEMDICVVYHS